MSVKFKIPKPLRAQTDGAILIDVQGGTVFECITDLIRNFPGLRGMILDGEGRMLLKWMVYINNKAAVPSKELSAQVKDGDHITLLPLVAGG